MPHQHLCVFAKAPSPGHVKTRLGLDPALAAQLAAAALRDTLQRHAQPRRQIEVWRVGDLEHPAWLTLGCPLRVQAGADLGARMRGALTTSVEAHGAAALIGSDSPTLPPEYVDEAFARLKDHDLVLGPAEDGGYYLIGASIPPPAALFEGIEWSAPDVLTRTLTRIERAGLSVHLLPPWYDLDRPDDLERIRARPGAPPAVETLRRLEQADPRYCATLSTLFARYRFGEKLDLSTPKALNEALGRPLSAYRSVLIAGTNGKGSAAAFLDALLRGAGLRVGVFTSPHLSSFTERIKLDGAPIAPRRIPPLFEGVIEAARAADLRPSFFEAAWGMAARAFAEARMDVVIWEVGLGGRLDATNVCDPVASGVTSVGLDHTHILGDTIEAIAAEKAGVFRASRPALTAATGSALEGLRAAWPEVEEVAPLPASIKLPLPGAHQRSNAALAVALAGALGITPDLEDLKATRWPGRLERVGDLILDCAHNPHAVEALAAAMEAQGLDKVHLIFGAMEGKDAAGMAAGLKPLASSVALVTPSYPRRMTAAELAPHFEDHPAVTLHDDVISALEGRPADQLTLVVGSCFLIAEARAWLYTLPQPECGLSTKAR